MLICNAKCGSNQEHRRKHYTQMSPLKCHILRWSGYFYTQTIIFNRGGIVVFQGVKGFINRVGCHLQKVMISLPLFPVLSRKYVIFETSLLFAHWFIIKTTVMIHWTSEWRAYLTELCEKVSPCCIDLTAARWGNFPTHLISQRPTPHRVWSRASRCERLQSSFQIIQKDKPKICGGERGRRRADPRFQPQQPVTAGSRSDCWDGWVFFIVFAWADIFGHTSELREPLLVLLIRHRVADMVEESWFCQRRES